MIGKDQVSGALFILLGLITVVLSRAYPIGTLDQMGPGFVPLLLGVAMSLLGGLVALRSLLGVRTAVDRLPVAPFLWIAAGVAVFALTLERVGFLFAAGMLVLLSSFADRTPKGTGLLVAGIAMVGLSALLFIVVLGLPVRLIGS